MEVAVGKWQGTKNRVKLKRWNGVEHVLDPTQQYYIGHMSKNKASMEMLEIFC